MAQVPEGWEQRMHGKHPYYFHAASGVSQWEFPAAATETVTAAAAPNGALAGLPSPSKDELKHILGHHTLPPGWHECYDDHGHAYYFHSATGHVTWSFPEASQASVSSTSSKDENLEEKRVLISGAKGPNAQKVNGIFIPMSESLNGQVLYQKQGDLDTWLRFDRDANWMVSPTVNKDANDDIGIAHSVEAGNHLVTPTLAKTWMVLDESGNFVVQRDIVVTSELSPVVAHAERALESALTSNEPVKLAEACQLVENFELQRLAQYLPAKMQLTQAVVQVRDLVAITGAVGPNAKKVNGIFRPTGKMHNLRPLFQHQEHPDWWLCFMTKDGCNNWMVSPTVNKDANDAAGTAHTVEKNLFLPTEAKRWLVFDGTQFTEQASLVVGWWDPNEVWTIHYDAEGNPYYKNSVTGETQWHHPTTPLPSQPGQAQREVPRLAPAPAPALRQWDDGLDPLPPGWTRSLSGAPYELSIEDRDFEEELLTFYQEHGPEKISKIPQILSTWATEPGGFPEMMVQVQLKYYTAKVEAFYQEHAPLKVSTVPKVIAQWQREPGGFPKMMRELHRKYDVPHPTRPEAPASPTDATEFSDSLVSLGKVNQTPRSASKGTPSGSRGELPANLTREEAERLLTAFYTTHRPEKAYLIPGALDKWGSSEGGYTEMMQVLHKKYGVPLSAPANGGNDALPAPSASPRNGNGGGDGKSKNRVQINDMPFQPAATHALLADRAKLREGVASSGPPPDLQQLASGATPLRNDSQLEGATANGSHSLASLSAEPTSSPPVTSPSDFYGAQQQTPSAPPSGVNTYEVEFPNENLGFAVDHSEGGLVVTIVTPGHEGRIEGGDVVLAVNGVSLADMSISNGTQLKEAAKQTKKPLRVTFQRVLESPHPDLLNSMLQVKQHEQNLQAKLPALQRGSLVQKKLSNESKYKTRFVFLGASGSTIHWAKGESLDQRNNAKGVSLKNAEIREGPPERFRESEGKVRDFDSRTLSILHPGDSKIILDLLFQSKEDCETWTAVLQIASGSSGGPTTPASQLKTPSLVTPASSQSALTPFTPGRNGASAQTPSRTLDLTTPRGAETGEMSLLSPGGPSTPATFPTSFDPNHSYQRIKQPLTKVCRTCCRKAVALVSALPRPAQNLPKPLQSKALSNFSQVMQYMGDDKKGTKARDLGLMRAVILNGEQSVEMRNEIFLQLLKQTRQNGTVQSQELGWELIAGTVSNFYPRDEKLHECLSMTARQSAVAPTPQGALALYTWHRLNAAKTASVSLPEPVKLSRVRSELASYYIPSTVFGTPQPPQQRYWEEGGIRWNLHQEGVLLEQVIGKERIRSYGLDNLPDILNIGAYVPGIVMALCKILTDYTGDEIRDVFRQPESQSEASQLRLKVARLQTDVEEGDYSALDESVEPLVAAHLLKQWLRSLKASPKVDSNPGPSGLIPPDLYDECIKAGRTNTGVPEILAKLPALSKCVLQYLVGHMRMIASGDYQVFMDRKEMARALAPVVMQSKTGRQRDQKDAADSARFLDLVMDELQ